MKMKIKLEGFNSLEDLKNKFDIKDDDLKDITILYALYEPDDYSGECIVLFQRDTKYYAIFGSHCSCDEFQGQWQPEKFSEDFFNYFKKYQPAFNKFYDLVK